MKDVKVCRICLIRGVKMHDLHSYPLKSYFETIFGNNPPSMMQLPPYGCYQCTALVVKLHRFRERCLAGQAVLCSILQTEGKITNEALNRIDRKRLNLASNLCLAQNKMMYCIVKNGNETFEVKVELPKQEHSNDKYIVQYDYIKEEHSYNTDVDNHEEIPVTAVYSDDDEVKLYNLKEQTESVRENTVKLETEFVEVSFNSDDELQQAIESIPKASIDIEYEPEGQSLARVTDANDSEEEQGNDSEEEERGNTKHTGSDDFVTLEEFVTAFELTTEEQLEEMRKRQQSSNYVNALFKCNLCFKGFISEGTFKHHVAKHDPSAGEHECPICKYRYPLKGLLRTHAAKHKERFACKSCPFVSKCLEQAKKHHRWHNGFMYKCQYCDEVSTKWTTHLSHVRLKHPSEFICGVCGTSYVSKLGLAMHKSRMHKNLVQETEPEGEDKKPGPYCQECDVQFFSVEAWKRHLVTSAKHAPANDLRNICRDCGTEFGSKEELRRHRRAEHAQPRLPHYKVKKGGDKRAPAPSGDWPATCQLCPKKIRNGREYWAHFRRAHPDKPYPRQGDYVCDICGKRFKINALLVYHRRIHTGEKPYKCTQCPKAFSNSTSLHTHETTTHSEERPYLCSLCSKTFKRQNALDKHLTCHTGEKRFKCKVCGKAYRLQDSMRLHYKTVHLKQAPPHRPRKRRPEPLWSE